MAKYAQKKKKKYQNDFLRTACEVISRCQNATKTKLLQNVIENFIQKF